jgi:SAM-dependent methyltransferase
MRYHASVTIENWYPGQVNDQERWRSEAQFFDDEEYNEGPIPENTIRRYQECLHPFTPAEYPFAALGDVRGKRIFELGCGDGGNAVLLALKGAYVVGVDVSPRAVEIAARRASLHGLQDRTEFHAIPVERYLEEANSKFDVICGFAVLHHLLPVLDTIMTSLKRLGHDSTTYLFIEPIATSPVLRKLRLMLPISVHATPDERPLDLKDLAIIWRHLPAAELHHQAFLTRFWSRFVGGRIEDYSSLRRMLYHALCQIDSKLLSVPGTRALASNGVIISKPIAS